MATTSGETEGAGGVGEGGHSAEDLAALPMRDLLARRGRLVMRLLTRKVGDFLKR